MGKALIIGCGGVASVTIHKCCQNSDVFEEIMIASRTKSKCDALKAKLKAGLGRDVALDVNVDPAILGGLVVQVGSRMIDSSIRTKLGAMAQAMKG